MSVSSREAVFPTENPFKQYTPPSRTTAPRRAAQASPTQPRLVASPIPVAPVGSQSATRQWKQQQRRLNLKTAGVLLAVGLVGFCMLPLPLQKKVYTVIGIPASPPADSTTITQHVLPVDFDYISSHFGKRWGRQHQGIDFAAQSGKPILAVADGTVIHSGWEFGYGKSVVVDHGNGTHTRYAHCSSLLIKRGKTVSKGDVIAKVGSTGHSTGPHLHFEVIVDGVRKNPVWYYNFKKPRLASASQTSK